MATNRFCVLVRAWFDLDGPDTDAHCASADRCVEEVGQRRGQSRTEREFDDEL